MFVECGSYNLWPGSGAKVLATQGESNRLVLRQTLK
jgi:hypothetical protein